MNAKRFVKMVAGLELTGHEVLDDLVRQARGIDLASAIASATKGEAKDRGNAEAAIDILKRTAVNPFGGSYRNDSFNDAVDLEIARLCVALADPDPYALKRIFRRKET